MGQAAQFKRDRAPAKCWPGTLASSCWPIQTAEWDRAKAMTLMENWIQSYGGPKINAVFAQNDEMAMGALMALEQAKLKDKRRGGERGCHRGRASGCARMAVWTRPSFRTRGSRRRGRGNGGEDYP